MVPIPHGSVLLRVRPLSNHVKLDQSWAPALVAAYVGVRLPDDVADGVVLEERPHPLIAVPERRPNARHPARRG